MRPGPGSRLCGRSPGGGDRGDGTRLRPAVLAGPGQLANLRRNLRLAAEPASPRSFTAAPRRALATPRTRCWRSCARSARSRRRSDPLVLWAGRLCGGDARARRGRELLGARVPARRGGVGRGGADRPADRILVETDSPFLSPPGAPRRRNEPEWVRVVAEWAADRRGIDREAFGDQLVANYDRLLGTAHGAEVGARPGAPV